jgi:hypothetical protein
MGTPIAFNSGTTASYDAGVFKKGTIALNLANSLVSGYNWWNGVDVTSSQYLIYSDTFSQGQATFANSRPTAWTTPDLSDASLVALINTLPDRVGLPGFTDVTSALNWMNQTGKYYLVKTGYDDIVTSGLIANFDAGWYNSYPGTGTSIHDISGNFTTGTLFNGVGFSNSGQGTLTFDGTNDYVAGSLVSTLSAPFTFEVWGKFDSLTRTNYEYFGALGGVTNNGMISISKIGTQDANTAYHGFLYVYPGANDTVKTNINLKSLEYQQLTVVLLSSSPYIKVYKNGVEGSMVDSLTGPINLSNNNFFFSTWANSTWWLDGNIAIYRVYNSALTQGQIVKNFNAQRYRFGLNNNVITGGAISIMDAKNVTSYIGSGTKWNDLTGNNNDGTLVNGVVYSTDLGGCLKNDSTNEGIPFPGVNDSQQWTICITFRRDGNPGGYGRIAGTYSTIDRGEIALLDSAGTLGLNPPLSAGWLTTTTNIALNEVCHLTVYFSRNRSESNNVMVWKNGVQEYTNTITDVDKGPTTGYVLGSRSDYNAENLPSSFVNVQTYNRKLSATEILQNYYQGSIVVDNLVSFLDASNIVSYPTSGTVWENLVSGSANSTLNNGPTYSTNFGGVLQFDGVNDYAIAASPGTYSEYTFMFFCQWVAPAGNDRIFGLDSFGTYTVFAPTNVAFHYNPLGGVPSSVVFYSGVNIGYGRWFQIAISVSASKSLVTIYIDGVARNTTSVIPSGSWSGNYLLGSQYTSTLYSNCQIGNFMLYDRELNALEVSQNFQAQKSRFGL